MEREDSDVEELLISSYLLLDDEDEPPRKKRLWVRDIFKNRGTFGQFHTLYEEMRNSDRESFFW